MLRMNVNFIACYFFFVENESLFICGICDPFQVLKQRMHLLLFFMIGVTFNKWMGREWVTATSSSCILVGRCLAQSQRCANFTAPLLVLCHTVPHFLPQSLTSQALCHPSWVLDDVTLLFNLSPCFYPARWVRAKWDVNFYVSHWHVAYELYSI